MVSYLFLLDLLNMIHEEKIKSTFLFLVDQTIKIAQKKRKKSHVKIHSSSPVLLPPEEKLWLILRQRVYESVLV